MRWKKRSLHNCCCTSCTAGGARSAAAGAAVPSAKAAGPSSASTSFRPSKAARQLLVRRRRVSNCSCSLALKRHPSLTCSMDPLPEGSEAKIDGSAHCNSIGNNPVEPLAASRCASSGSSSGEQAREPSREVAWEQTVEGVHGRPEGAVTKSLGKPLCPILPRSKLDLRGRHMFKGAVASPGRRVVITPHGTTAKEGRGVVWTLRGG
mmetsp:Transcript_31571/g.104664  ORF Transcript_31571/g.104664 Transcript_31571/m.104664 type:complete len:207 (+) Transcript_31571:278-898(+)